MGKVDRDEPWPSDLAAAMVQGACHERRIHIDVEWIGGGLETLRVPLSEDGERYAMFGRGRTERDVAQWPFWNDPDVAELEPTHWLIAYAYRYDGEDHSQTPEPIARPVGPDVAETIEAMLRGLAAIPIKEYVPC